MSAPFEGIHPEPNTLGGFLVFMMYIIMGISIHIQKKQLKYILLLMFMFTGFPLAWTQSRASYAAFMFGLLFISILSKKKIFILTFTLIFLIASPIIIPKVAKKRIEYTFTYRVKFKKEKRLGQTNIKLDPSSIARLNSWKRISHWVQSSMLNTMLGYGVTTVGLVDAYYVLLIGEIGFVGLIFHLLLFRLIFMNTWIRYKSSKSDNIIDGLFLGYCAGFAALLTHAIVANTFIIVRIAGPFWLVTGALFKYMRFEEDNLEGVLT